MRDWTPTLRFSRRNAIRMMVALAGAALIPLGSIAAAQSTSEPDDEAQPDGAVTTQPASPTVTAQPARSSSGSTRNNRFSPAPPAPQPSPTPELAGGSPTTTAAPAAGQQTSAASAPSTAGSWVQNHRETELWSGPDDKAVSFGSAPVFSYFKVMGAQEGSRIKVQNPLTNGIAYLTAKDTGPSGAPPEWYLNQKNQTSLLARVVGGANIRSAPVIQDDTLVGHAGHNESITVLGEVKDANGETWYRIGQNQLVHGSLVRMPAKSRPHPGKLIVAELTDPCIVTAYEDGKQVYTTLSLKGTQAWATPTGFFTILRRVENEIMSSESLGIPRNAPGGYYLKDVLYTQYFTNDGASIHYNYWSSNWGYSGSHGCLGMSHDDALWFWQWVDIGTPIAIQE